MANARRIVDRERDEETSGDGYGSGAVRSQNTPLCSGEESVKAKGFRACVRWLIMLATVVTLNVTSTARTRTAHIALNTFVR